MNFIATGKFQVSLIIGKQGKKGGKEGMYTPRLEKDIRCPWEYGLTVFGGKWKSRVIRVLAEKGTLRYSAIREEMTNITDAVLASTLKN